jgi:hypothetical protein
VRESCEVRLSQRKQIELMTANPEMQPPAERRLQARSNFFLSATLVSGGNSIPVRIRNLSADGALIDGSALPDVGCHLRLSRGTLAATGELMWRDKSYGGVRFVGRIDVDAWVRGASGGQERVDRVIAAIRRGQPVPAELKAPAVPSIAEISTALDQLCDRLSNLPNMSVELGEELVRLDAIAQSLREHPAARKS